MNITDAHHHIWWKQMTPWLNGPMAPKIFGEYQSIRRDYSIDEYNTDVAPNGVTKSVYVQINLPPEQAAWEVEAVRAAGRTQGLIQAVVAQADLRSPTLDAELDQIQALGGVRGIRQQLHWHPTPAYRFAASPTQMLDPRWRRGLGQLAKRDLLFEVQVFPQQMPDMLRIIDERPDLTFVLLHAGMLEDRSEDGWTTWRSALHEAARRPNLLVKLSGLGTFVRRCTVPDWKPVIEQTIEEFGPTRCMFGSNFPIEKIWTDYATLIDVFTQSIAGYSLDERAAILGTTADSTYRINEEF
ncbi:amidohydrolase family protein [Nocardioides sp.]|uniref:amidohydrolase family protein n=1 Tax=Nocardioides sp. TaxID=35761 RepID=UPI003783B5DC